MPAMEKAMEGLQQQASALKALVKLVAVDLSDRTAPRSDGPLPTAADVESLGKTIDSDLAKLFATVGTDKPVPDGVAPMAEGLAKTLRHLADFVEAFATRAPSPVGKAWTSLGDELLTAVEALSGEVLSRPVSSRAELFGVVRDHSNQLRSLPLNMIDWVCNRCDQYKGLIKDAGGELFEAVKEMEEQTEQGQSDCKSPAQILVLKASYQLVNDAFKACGKSLTFVRKLEIPSPTSSENDEFVQWCHLLGRAAYSLSESVDDLVIACHEMSFEEPTGVSDAALDTFKQVTNYFKMIKERAQPPLAAEIQELVKSLLTHQLAVVDATNRAFKVNA